MGRKTGSSVSGLRKYADVAAIPRWTFMPGLAGNGRGHAATGTTFTPLLPTAYTPNSDTVLISLVQMESTARQWALTNGLGWTIYCFVDGLWQSFSPVSNAAVNLPWGAKQAYQNTGASYLVAKPTNTSLVAPTLTSNGSTSWDSIAWTQAGTNGIPGAPEFFGDNSGIKLEQKASNGTYSGSFPLGNSLPFYGVISAVCSNSGVTYGSGISGANQIGSANFLYVYGRTMWGREYGSSYATSAANASGNTWSFYINGFGIQAAPSVAALDKTVSAIGEILIDRLEIQNTDALNERSVSVISGQNITSARVPKAAPLTFGSGVIKDESINIYQTENGPAGTLRCFALGRPVV